MKVRVLDSKGQPLDPTGRNAKVRLMLKNKDAVIVSYNPFTIQLQEGDKEDENIKKFRKPE